MGKLIADLGGFLTGGEAVNTDVWWTVFLQLRLPRLAVACTVGGHAWP